MCSALMLSLIASAIRIKLPANAFQCDFIPVWKATKNATKKSKKLKSVMLVQQHLTAKKNQNKTTENKVNQNKIFFFPSYHFRR